ncbi:MAG: hypothetical protein N2C14_22100 [Planctomycetales bacterium]
MAIFTQCPQCEGTIQVADRYSDPSTQMICPTCDAEFPLHEALDHLADSPPEARPADEAAAAIGSAAATGSAASDSDGPNFSNSASDSSGSNGSGSDSDGPDFGVGEAEDVSRPAFANVGSDDGDYQDDDEQDDLAANARRRASRQPSVIGNMIGVVGGGVIGLSMGYYGLCFFMPHKNFLQIKMPGIPLVDANGDPVIEDSGQNVGFDFDSEPIDTSKPLPQPGGLEFNPSDPPEKPRSRENLNDPVASKIDETLVKKRDSDKSNNAAIKPPKPEGPVQGAPTFDSVSLGKRLGAAHSALKGDPPPMNRDVFGKLNALGEAMTYVNDKSSSRLPGQISAAKKLPKTVGSNSDTVRALTSLGLVHWQTAEQGGFTLAGEVLKVTEQGPWIIADVQPMNASQLPIPVVAKLRYNMVAGKRVVILGAVVSNPSAILRGFQGDDRKVILTKTVVVIGNDVRW